MWYKRRHIRHTNPWVRLPCWECHTFCPFLRIYPADATGPEDLEQVSHIGQQVVIQTTPQYPPSSSAPYPMSEAPHPTSGAPYPPYGAPASDIQHGPPADEPPQQVVIQTTPQYPPSSAAPYPLSEAPFPTSGTPYPPYGAPVSDIQFGPPVDAPPPSYISVTEGRKKTSGGWFTARQ